jgi:hypothetical protein
MHRSTAPRIAHRRLNGPRLKDVQPLTAHTMLVISTDNIYNIDEKGFLIGKLQKTPRIFTRELYKQGNLTGADQDGNYDLRRRHQIIACSNLQGDLW